MNGYERGRNRKKKIMNAGMEIEKRWYDILNMGRNTKIYQGRKATMFSEK